MANNRYILHGRTSGAGEFHEVRRFATCEEARQEGIKLFGWRRYHITGVSHIHRWGRLEQLPPGKSWPFGLCKLYSSNETRPSRAYFEELYKKAHGGE
jgi:hypothetical protein